MILSKDFLPDDVRVELGNWVRKIRERHQMTQEEFASHLGYRGRTSISQIESGRGQRSLRKTINLYVIKRICEKFNARCVIHINENGKLEVQQQD